MSSRKHGVYVAPDGFIGFSGHGRLKFFSPGIAMSSLRHSYCRSHGGPRFSQSDKSGMARDGGYHFCVRSGRRRYDSHGRGIRFILECITRAR